MHSHVLQMCEGARMNWDDARFLLALRRSRNVSDAGRLLGVSHTTVARRLAALARALEVRLVERGPDGPRLTAEAAEVARLAEPMEVAVNAMRRRVAGAEKRLVGRVRVTSTEALSARLLAPALAELAGRHPGLTVELMPDPRALSLARREADVAVRLLRPRERATVGRRVARLAYAAYASGAARAEDRASRHLLAYAAPVAGEETAWLERRFAGAPVVLRSRSTLALAAAAAAGCGVAVLPCFVGDADPGLVRLSGADEVSPSEVWLVVHRDLRRSARTVTVADHLASTLGRAREALEGIRHNGRSVDIAERTT
jgi:DNA-binding transcriptional LysR family regulator